MKRRDLLVRSYLEMLVDALMMMIPTILINLRRLKRALCPMFAQGSQCVLSPAQQMSTISNLLCMRKKLYDAEKYQEEIIGHHNTNENSLIKKKTIQAS